MTHCSEGHFSNCPIDLQVNGWDGSVIAGTSGSQQQLSISDVVSCDRWDGHVKSDDGLRYSWVCLRGQMRTRVVGVFVLVCVDFRLFLEIYIDFGSLVKRECKMFLCLRFLRIPDQKKWNIKIGPTWTIVLSGNLMLPGIYFLECFVLTQNVTVDGCSLNSRAHQVWGSIMSSSSLEVSQIGAECVHVRRARVSAALDRSAK